MYLDAFLYDAQASGFSNVMVLEGCSQAEVLELEAKLNTKLPEAYCEFLMIMGKDAGSFLSGSDYTCNDLPHLQGVARALLGADQIEDQLPLDAVVFFMHQGYQFTFFRTSQGADPLVYAYSETYSGEEQGVVKLCDTFTDFLMSEFKRHEYLKQQSRARQAQQT